MWLEKEIWVLQMFGLKKKQCVVPSGIQPSRTIVVNGLKEFQFDFSTWTTTHFLKWFNHLRWTNWDFHGWMHFEAGKLSSW